MGAGVKDLPCLAKEFDLFCAGDDKILFSEDNHGPREGRWISEGKRIRSRASN